MNIKKIGLIILYSLLFIGLFGCEKNNIECTDSFFGAFDTIITVTSYCKNKSEFNEFKKKVESKSLEYSKLYDKYTEVDGLNNIYTINQNAGIKPVKVDKKLVELIEYSISINDKYNGKVNITFGSVLDVWHKYRENSVNNNINQIPSIDELNEANRHTSLDNIVIDKENSTIYLKDPNSTLDVGAIAKGYAVERIANELIEEGYTNFIINAGGNVKAVGFPERENKKWGIGIQNPVAIKDSTKNELLNVVYAKDISVVTSGVYQRYYTVDGVDYHHIIDPSTLYPGRYYQSVSIISKDSGLCDYLSTNSFLTKPEEAMKLIESIENVEAIFLLSDGNIMYSSGMQEYLED
ncbi:MAG: FAD:protein FMN transferase [Filifactoraceae bacterium]